MLAHHPTSFTQFLIYATRDLASDKFRLDKYGQDIIIVNEVGVEQELYFQQLFEIEALLGYVKVGQRVHVKHGFVTLKSGKMSTRKGNAVWLSEIIEEAYKRAEKLIAKKTQFSNISKTERDYVIRDIAIGSLKWNKLKSETHLDSIFDWNEVLSMTGNSAPYVQYTYSRCMSLLSKSSVQNNDITSFQMSENERQIVKHLANFSDVVMRSAEEFSPHYICHYLFELCQMFNSYYAKFKIIGEPEEALRISIVHSVSNVLQSGLYLLGIKAPERM